MKKILIIILFPLICNCQTSTDSTMISNEKLVEIAKEKRERRDSLNTYLKLVPELELKIENHIRYSKQDSVELVLKDMTIVGQQRVIQVYQSNTKTKWYETSWFYYTLGAVTMYLSAQIVSTVR